MFLKILDLFIQAQLLMLVTIITSSVILWSHGSGPEFIHKKAGVFTLRLITLFAHI